MRDENTGLRVDDDGNVIAQHLAGWSTHVVTDQRGILTLSLLPPETGGGEGCDDLSLVMRSDQALRLASALYRMATAASDDAGLGEGRAL